ncbi:MAG: hypothetical protein JWL89_226 [Candidatus Saccharibacteria bacterium]|jgi:hypothetical protein|nr:hypothetical protein [Candidatus Saccharibacteria bacterium]
MRMSKQPRIKRVNFKKFALIGLLAGCLMFITINHVYPYSQLDDSVIAGVSLPVGWHAVADQNACEIDDEGWPLLAYRTQPTCDFTDTNYIAVALNILLPVGAYVLLASLIVYLAQRVRGRLPGHV